MAPRVEQLELRAVAVGIILLLPSRGVLGHHHVRTAARPRECTRELEDRVWWIVISDDVVVPKKDLTKL